MRPRSDHSRSPAPILAVVGLVLVLAAAGTTATTGAAAPAAPARQEAGGAVGGPAGGVTSGETGRAGTPPRSERPSSTSPVRRVSAKKGVSLWPGVGMTRSLRRSGSTWFWNWDSARRGVLAPRGVEFVPTLWGQGSLTPTRLAEVERSGSRHLLAFNEPDHTDQADMSVTEALDLWPQLEATGLRLSSPAVAEGAAVADGWLDRFMSGARERGLRVDFLAIHWYGSDFHPERATAQLRDYLVSVHQRYGKPIWLTEYGLLGFEGGVTYPDRAAQARFITRSTRMLEGLRFVQRYAWFSLPAAEPWGRTGLFRSDATPTQAGRAYAKAGPRGG